MEFAARYRDLAFWALVIIFVGLGATMFAPFLPAFLWACVLSVLVFPIYRKFRQRWGENVSASLTTASAILIIALPLSAVGTVLALQITSFANEVKSSSPAGTDGFTIESLLKQADTSIQPIAKNLGADNVSLERYYHENKDQLLKNVTAPAAKAVTSTVYTIFTLIMAMIMLFFMVRDAHRVKDPFLELMPFSRERGEQLLAKLAGTIHAVFIGVVLVAVLQGVTAGIAYWIAQVPSPLIWTVATIIMAAIPLLGAPVVYGPLSLMLIAQGKVVPGVALLAFCAIIVSNIDNAIRPFVIGARTAFHPMAVFFSLLGGVLVVGPIGIMAGPLVLTVLLVLQDVVRERMREAKAEPEVPSEA